MRDLSRSSTGDLSLCSFKINSDKSLGELRDESRTLNELTYQTQILIPLVRGDVCIESTRESLLHKLRTRDLDVTSGLLGRHHLEHERIFDPDLDQLK